MPIWGRLAGEPSDAIRRLASKHAAPQAGPETSLQFAGRTTTYLLFQMRQWSDSTPVESSVDRGTAAGRMAAILFFRLSDRNRYQTCTRLDASKDQSACCSHCRYHQPRGNLPVGK